MPRPRHPIREHFHEITGSSRKNGGIGCNYCGKEQSAGNPKRCQKHLDECPHYAQALAALESGELPSISFENPAPSQNDGSPQYAPAVSTPNRLSDNSCDSVPAPTTTTSTTSTKETPVPLATNERMDEDAVIRMLRIDESTYLVMERELDAQMMRLNLSGAGLITTTGMKLLRHAIVHMNGQFPEVLQGIQAQDKRLALTSMAYICNRKRRNGEAPNLFTPRQNKLSRKSLMHSTPGLQGGVGPIAPMFTSPQQPETHFGAVTIIAERAEQGGAFVVCRPSDLIEELKDPGEITANDVKFGPFIQLLQEDDDVLFNATNDDKIVYTFTGGRTKAVSNEIVWRVALEDMHKKGMNPYVFKIYKRQPGTTLG